MIEDEIKVWIEPKLWFSPATIRAKQFWIAGSSLRPQENINDLDLYPISGTWKEPTVGYTSTRNSWMIRGKYPIQLCHIRAPSLEGLVESFDFAHVKLGAEVHWNDGWVVRKVYVSENYEPDRVFYCPIADSTPLNSLIRLFKYYKRDLSIDLRFNVRVILKEWIRRNGGSVTEKDVQITQNLYE